MATRRLTIEVSAPFRLDLTVWALRRRAHNTVDSWDGHCWRRTLAVGGQAIGVALSQPGDPRHPSLTVELQRPGSVVSASDAAMVTRVLERTLGLHCDLGGFYRLASRDRRLFQLVAPYVGMRPPAFPSVFEAAVNAVACQQLSLDVGIHLLNRVAERYGPALSSPGAPPGFPLPEALATADTSELRSLGLSLAKARALICLARKVARGELDLDGLRDVPDDEARERLCRLFGIGRWSAEYVLLRGLRRLEVLPGDDVGARNHLRRRFGLEDGAGYEAVVALAQAWWPYGGLVYFHLLLDSLAAAGSLAETPRSSPGPRPRRCA